MMKIDICCGNCGASDEIFVKIQTYQDGECYVLCDSCEAATPLAEVINKTSPWHMLYDDPSHLDIEPEDLV